MTIEQYGRIRSAVRRLQKSGAIPTKPTREQRIDWAYGNAVIENPDVTRQIVATALDERESSDKGK